MILRFSQFQILLIKIQKHERHTHIHVYLYIVYFNKPITEAYKTVLRVDDTETMFKIE
jgi:hypothetical protein